MDLLVVVDAQPEFSNSFYETAIGRISRQISMSMRRNLPIIFVEYKGQTDKRLKKLTKYYQNTFFIEKKSKSGSKEILRTIKENKLSLRTLRVCGIYVEYCVADTVLGLSSQYLVEVMRPACASYYDKPNWAKLEGQPNVILRPVKSIIPQNREM